MKLGSVIPFLYIPVHEFEHMIWTCLGVGKMLFMNMGHFTQPPFKELAKSFHLDQVRFLLEFS